jgi:hypothetical protein
MALDTHRRRILASVGWTTQVKFDMGVSYIRHADGGIHLDKFNPPPPACFKVNIRA